MLLKRIRSLYRKIFGLGGIRLNNVNVRISTYNAIEWLDKKGRYHREDGPAFYWNYTGREWFIRGRCIKVDYTRSGIK